MPGRLSGFVVVFVSAFGLHAQENFKSQDSAQEQTAKRGRLFEGFGVKMPQDATGNVFEALRDKRVQAEIGLLPSQLEDLLRLNEQIAKETAPVVDEFNKLPKPEQQARARALRSDFADYLKGIQAEIDKILLPEQQQRLREIAFQLRMQKSGTAQTLLAPDVLRELGMDDFQAERLRDSLAKIEEEHSQRLQELELEKERKILALFSTSQQAKLKSFIGPMMRNLSRKASSVPSGFKP